jgi:hypothetical protein
LLTEYPDQSTTCDTRPYISSAPLDIDRLANAARGHWAVESLHWLLDVEFKDDLSRYRSGHGAKNVAIVAVSRLASFAPTKVNEASKPEEKQLVGTQTISSSCSNSNER